MREDVIRALVATGRFSEEAARDGERAGYRCTYCNRDLLACADNYRMWQGDHIVPLFAEGADTPGNIALSCRPCNMLKGKWDPRSVAGPAATRDELIQAVKGYLHDRRGQILEEVHRVKEIIKRPP